MTQIQQGAIEVIFTLVLAVAYYAISWKKCGDCDHKKLGWIPGRQEWRVRDRE